MEDTNQCKKVDGEKKWDFSVASVESGVNIYKTTTNPITYSTAPREVVMEKVPGLECAWYLHNVLDGDECQQIIDVTEKMGFDMAKLSTAFGMVEDTSTRNNKRLIWQSQDEVWMPIWERVKDKVPGSAKVWASNWEPYGLNERLRFYRYKKGEVFNPHYDGCFPRNNRDMSLLTFIIYLNDDFEGGHTTFFLRRKEEISVKPKQGSALIFWHGEHQQSPFHEGSECKGGTKYVFRSDVMYKRQ